MPRILRVNDPDGEPIGTTDRHAYAILDGRMVVWTTARTYNRAHSTSV